MKFIHAPNLASQTRQMPTRFLFLDATLHDITSKYSSPTQLLHHIIANQREMRAAVASITETAPRFPSELMLIVIKQALNPDCRLLLHHNDAESIKPYTFSKAFYKEAKDAMVHSGTWTLTAILSSTCFISSIIDNPMRGAPIDGHLCPAWLKPSIKNLRLVLYVEELRACTCDESLKRRHQKLLLSAVLGKAINEFDQKKLESVLVDIYVRDYEAEENEDDKAAMYKDLFKKLIKEHFAWNFFRHRFFKQLGIRVLSDNSRDIFCTVEVIKAESLEEMVDGLWLQRNVIFEL